MCGMCAYRSHRWPAPQRQCPTAASRCNPTFPACTHQSINSRTSTRVGTRRCCTYLHLHAVVGDPQVIKDAIEVLLEALALALREEDGQHVHHLVHLIEIHVQTDRQCHPYRHSQSSDHPLTSRHARTTPTRTMSERDVPGRCQCTWSIRPRGECDPDSKPAPACAPPSNAASHKRSAALNMASHIRKTPKIPTSVHIVLVLSLSPTHAYITPPCFDRGGHVPAAAS